jgi:hypothetical protein
MDFISVGGGEVGKGVEVVMDGRNLLLDRGEVDGDGDVDVGHLGCDFADGIKNNMMIMISEGRSKSLSGRMDKKTGEDEAIEERRRQDKLGSDHLS